MASSGGARRKSSQHQSAAAGGKKPSGTAGTRAVGAGSDRIRELESQVSELKKRLDELRKAKSQTIVKKDKEYVTSDAPNFGQRRQSLSAQDINAYKEQIRELQGKLHHLEKEKDKMLENHKTEIAKLKQQIKDQNKAEQSSFDDSELKRLRQENQTLQEERDSLTAQNTDLRLRVDELFEALSKKEAEWCDKEEKITQEIKLSWQEKYQQWMTQTEKKIEELQMANNFLRRIIDRDKPR